MAVVILGTQGTHKGGRVEDHRIMVTDNGTCTYHNDIVMYIQAIHYIYRTDYIMYLITVHISYAPPICWQQ